MGLLPDRKGRVTAAGGLLMLGLSVGLGASSRPAEAADALYGLVVGIDDYLGTVNDLQGAVNDANGMSNCCNLPTPGACNVGGTTHIDNYGLTRTVVTTPIGFKSLQCELSSDKRAMIFDLRWDGGGGHTIVLRGYDASNGEQWLWVNNPLPVDAGNSYLLSYDDYVDGPGYFYGRTEWGITYTGGP